MEHEIEMARFGEILGAAFGAFDLLFLDEGSHLLDGESFRALVKGLFNQVVAAESPFARLAVDEGVVEAVEMA
jgi:hypothetical protein